MSGFAKNAKRFMLLVVLVFAWSAGCAIHGAPRDQTAIPTGYLSRDALPDGLVLIPPPPSAGTVAFALDEETSRRYLMLRGTPHWRLAAEDADLTFPHMAGAFSCALDVQVTEQETPRLYNLLRRVMGDVSLSTRAVKNRYNRTRPFVMNKEPTCRPEDEKYLRTNGSYPSGHSATGWALALILVEVAPERTDSILVRGRAFGDSRLVCNVHWQSDVTEGRVIGAAVVARLHADPTFRADLEAAKKEVASARVKGLKPVRDCQAERTAMAERPTLKAGEMNQSGNGRSKLSLP